MNFQGYLENSFRIIKAEPLILILGGLLIQLLNSVTLSLLYGPLFGGYLLMALLQLRDNRKPVFNDLFTGFQQFKLLFPYFFILLAKIVGFMFFIIPGLLFTTWWVYALPLMVDRQIGFREAMRLSSDKVNETGFFMHLVFILLVYVIPVIILQVAVSLIPFLMFLTLLLLPFQVGCMASLYLDQFGPKSTEEKTADEKTPIAETAMTATPQTAETSAAAETSTSETDPSAEQTVTDSIDNGETQAAAESGGRKQEE